MTQGGETKDITPSTFEDAIALANMEAVKEAGETDLACRMTRTFAKFISTALTPDELAEKLFDKLRTSPEKAAFALDLLYIKDINALRAPPYIDSGLTWLAGQVKGVEGVL